MTSLIISWQAVNETRRTHTMQWLGYPFICMISCYTVTVTGKEIMTTANTGLCYQICDRFAKHDFYASTISMLVFDTVMVFWNQMVDCQRSYFQMCQKEPWQGSPKSEQLWIYWSQDVSSSSPSSRCRIYPWLYAQGFTAALCTEPRLVW